jgi:phosphatidate cytidylyltransferase
VLELGPVSSAGAAGGPASKAPTHNLLLRVASALLLAPLALIVAWLGGWPFVLFWAIAGLAVLWEWVALVVGPRYPLTLLSGGAGIAVAGMLVWRDRPLAAFLVVGLGALAAGIFAPRERRLWIAAGVGYAGLMVLAPVMLRADRSYGFAALALLFAIVWATDVVAYFAGRAIGGPKLSPTVSPSKTWSGAVAGALAAVVAAVSVAGFVGLLDKGTIALLAVLLSAIAQLGDLLESWIKRLFGAKDASRLIPGHGGVMDRLDGFWAAALAGCLVGVLRGGFDNAARGLLVW